MRTRLDDLDRLAADLANVTTAGYKTERIATEASERDFKTALDAAIDVTRGNGRTDFRTGTMTPTGRDLDVAIEGRGFFQIETPAGTRYTRGGNFTKQTDGLLTTADGSPVMGEDGEIRLPHGPVAILNDGSIRVGTAIVAKLKVFTFENEESDLVRETGTRFRAAESADPTEATEARLFGGTLEQSNVSMVERIAVMTEVMRSFEGLQKGISVLMNDIDGRAINELGRR
jgi:flagellar basal body rod protein FlgG